MGWEQTVKTNGELCLLVCGEYRKLHGEMRNCQPHEDCEICQLTKQAEISFKSRDAEIEQAKKEAYKAGAQAMYDEIKDLVTLSSVQKSKFGVK